MAAGPRSFLPTRERATVTSRRAPRAEGRQVRGIHRAVTRDVSVGIACPTRRAGSQLPTEQTTPTFRWCDCSRPAEIPSLMLSAVIPVYNEAESLRRPARRARRGGGRRTATTWRSSSSTTARPTARGRSFSGWPAPTRACAGIRFRRNFGKAAALSAGFAAARGELVMTLDADLQDDPHEIPRFLAADGNEKLDVVSGWKQVRHDPWHKVLPVAGLQLAGQLADRRAAARPQLRHEVLPPRGLRRSPALRRAAPLRAGAGRGPRLPRRRDWSINHRPRKFGHSKYGVRRFVKGFLDLLTVKFLTGFGQRPQHVLGTVGLVCFWRSVSVGLVYLAGTGSWRDRSPSRGLKPLHQRPAVIYSVRTLLLGRAVDVDRLSGRADHRLPDRATPTPTRWPSGRIPSPWPSDADEQRVEPYEYGATEHVPDDRSALASRSARC